MPGRYDFLLPDSTASTVARRPSTGPTQSSRYGDLFTPAPQKSEPLIARAAKGVWGKVKDVERTINPLRGFAMLGQEGMALATGKPSAVRLTPEGEESFSTIKGAAARAGEVADAVFRVPAAVGTAVQEYAAGVPAERSRLRLAPETLLGFESPGIEELLREENIKRPAAEMGRALAEGRPARPGLPLGMGVAAAAAARALGMPRVAEHLLPADPSAPGGIPGTEPIYHEAAPRAVRQAEAVGEFVADLAVGLPMYGKAFSTLGKASPIAARAAGLAFAPEMVIGGVEGAVETGEMARERGWSDPETLRTGLGSVSSLAFGGLGLKHGFAKDPRIAVAAAEAKARAIEEAAVEQAAFEAREREFLTPNREAQANAEQLRLAREFLQRRSISPAVRSALMGPRDPRVVPLPGPPKLTGTGSDMVRLSPAAEAEAGAVTRPEVAREMDRAARRRWQIEQRHRPEAIQEARVAAEQARLTREFLQRRPTATAISAALREARTEPRAGPPVPPAEMTGLGAEMVKLSPEAEAAAGVLTRPEVARPIEQAALRQTRRQAAEAPPGREQPPAEALPPPPAAPPPPAPAPEAPAEAPTPAQMEAGNYKKGHLAWQGLDISVETPKGGERVAKDRSWRVPDYPADYGYIRRTEGKDGDQVDVFMGDAPQSERVFVIDQIDPKTGRFDEHKAMLGFPDEVAALDTYRRAYTDGKASERVGAVTSMPVEEFKAWARGGDTKKPLAYKRQAEAIHPAVQPLEPRGPSAPPAGEAPIAAPGRPGAPAGPGEGAPPPASVPGAPAGTEGAPAAPTGERRAQPLAGPRERRAALALRKRVDLMEPEEMRRALLTDDLTGLGNRRAYEEAGGAEGPQAKLDVEGLKWVNDNLGQEAGDTLLRAVGAEFEKELGGHPRLRAYRVGGDEFFLRGDTAEQIGQWSGRLKQLVGEAVVDFRLPDGSTRSMRGIGLHHGIGANLAEADAALNAAKKAGVAAGERAARGEQPRGLREVSAPGEQARPGEVPTEAEAPAAVAPLPSAEAVTRKPDKAAAASLIEAAREQGEEARKPVTPQVQNEPGAKYVLPSFATKGHERPAKPAAAPEERLSQQEYQRLKAALTRAINLKDNRKIVETAEAGLKRFEETSSPDDWSRWERAKDDALFALQREPEKPAVSDETKARIEGAGFPVKPRPAEPKPSTEITIAFAEKPSKAIRDSFKTAGFRWDTRRSLWSARPSDTSRAVAERMRRDGSATVTGLPEEGAPKSEIHEEESIVKPGTLPEGWRIEEPLTGETVKGRLTDAELGDQLDAAYKVWDVAETRRIGEELVRRGVINSKDLGDMLATAEYRKKKESGGPEAPRDAEATLLEAVAERLRKGEAIKDNRSLDALAQEAFGGTRGQGKYTPRDAYDAMEAGVNRWIQENGKRLAKMEPKKALAELRDVLKRLPTQTDRTLEQKELQQFSTPPTQALVAVKAAGIRPEDVALEPSAGNGGIAVLIQAEGAKDVRVNEIAPRRVKLLERLGFKPTTSDAEVLNDVLPEDVRPTVIVMNPPFSATGGRVQANKTEYGARHVTQALQRLEPGGRLVAIVGQGMKFPESVRGVLRTEPGNRHQIALAEDLGFKQNGYGKWEAPDTPEARAGLSRSGQVFEVIAAPKPSGRHATGAAFADWWADILPRYNVRANIGIPGDEYSKYGTAFGNQILVIDKTGPTPGATMAERLQNVARGSITSLEDALDALLPIGAERKAGEPRATPLAPEPSRPVEPGGAGVDGAPRGGAAAPGGDVGGRPGPGRPPSGGRPGGPRAPIQAGEPGARPEQPAEGQLRDRPGRAPDVGRVEPPPDEGGRLTEEPTAAAPTRREGPIAREEESGGTFVQYAPAKLDTKGLAKHPADIVEAASMAAVDPPEIRVRTSLPEAVLKEGRLSDIQYEQVLYAKQRHEQTLPDGARGGHFIGDGTGVGKGREIAGVILDNWHQGRKRSLWVSVSRDLIEDAKRDMEGVAGKDKIPIVSINAFPASGDIKHDAGILFTTYNSLISTGKKVAGAPPGHPGHLPAGGNTRLEQIKRWLGKDGVIVFDEAHKAKNALSVGRAQPSQTGQAVIQLQTDLPGARVLYVSATGATDVRNMAYMTRLGLWAPEPPRAGGLGGPTPQMSAQVEAHGALAARYPFPGGFNEFLNEIESGGVGAKEMVSRDLKALGMYAARSLSFKGVEYAERIHETTTDQRQMYDASARAWQVVLQNIENAIGITNANARARTSAMQAFWGAHQRFFRQVTTAIKMPTIIKETEEALAAGESVIVTLKGTGEGKTSELVSKATGEGLGLEELDFTPRQTLASMLDKAFPTQMYEEVRDPTDPTKTVKVAMVRDGKPVQSREALALKKQIMDGLSDLNLPDNPLDQFISHFGEKNVAELTGRARRLVRNKKTGKVTYESRASDEVSRNKVNVHEMRQFQGGKKRIAIISRAASTGISLHSSNQEKNQQRRRQIAAELDWSADAELQTMGRAHRSDQAQTPVFVLVSTDIGGEKRFSSTIARRLASLGALTRGQRDASGGGELAKYNFETVEGEAALEKLYWDMERGSEIVGVEDTRQAIVDMGLSKEEQGRSVRVPDAARRDVTRFLNRILSLDLQRQNAIFGEFTRKFDDTIRQAKEEGTFDDGVVDLKAVTLNVRGDPTLIHTDATTGAETKHLILDAEEATPRMTWREGIGGGTGIARQKTSKRLVMVGKTRDTTDAQTGAVRRVQGLWNNRGDFESIPESEFNEKYEIVTDRKEEVRERLGSHPEPIGASAKAIRDEWEAAVAKLPKTEKREHHIIAGSILPIWQRLKGDEQGLRIIRAQADNGQRIVGVEIPKNEVGRVLQSLGVGRTFETPEQVFTAVFHQGEAVALSENLVLRRTKVHGERRVEVSGVKSSRFQHLRSMGLIEEQIEYRTRFFVPTEQAEGVRILRNLMDAYPPMAPEKKPAAATDAGQAALDRLKKRGETDDPLSMGAAAGMGAETLRDATIYGASLIQRGMRDFGGWAKAMMADVGLPGLGRHLRAVYPKARAEAGTPAPGLPARPAAGGDGRPPRAGLGLISPPPGGPRPPPVPTRGAPAAPDTRRPSVVLAEDAVTASNRAKRVADTFEATNRKFEIAQEGAQRIEERGTIAKGERPAFRRAGQPAPEETRGFRFSERDIEQAGAEIVSAVKEFQAAEQRFTTGADANSAYQMRLSRQIMEQAVKNWQVYRTSAGRAVKRFDRPIPQEVIQRLREAGLIAGNIKDVKERIPIASNILRSLRNWSTLSDPEKAQFRRDLVDHFRLNLFSTTSWTLDAVGNASELAAQGGAGIGRDLVLMAKGQPYFPSMQALFRTIRTKTQLPSWRQSAVEPMAPDVEARLETTIAGERMGRAPGAGIFTYRKGLGSTAYDYTVGLPLYFKQGMDTAAKRLGAHWTLYREAIEASHREQVSGADREAFIERFLQDPPTESLDRAISNGKKAGFNRDLSKLEEKVADSTTARLLVDTFARWPFQFTRWAGEMLGWNPEMYQRLKAGTLKAEDVGEYLGKVATGLGGLYLINNLYDRVDFNSMEYVDDDGNRIRLSNRDPLPTALWLLTVIRGAHAVALGNEQEKDEAISKAVASLRHASIPGGRLLAGEGGLLGGLIKTFLRAAENPQNDPRALRGELENTINRAIPGQAVLSALKTLFDPTIREGIGANLPGVSHALPGAVNPVTGEPLRPRQKIGIPFTDIESPSFPSLGGTPIPGATRLLEPVQKLLSRYGLMIYRGPRGPIAGYPPSEVPEELRREWQEAFGKFRNRLLTPLTRSMRTLEGRDDEAVRKLIQQRDRVAAEMANREMRRRHGGPKKLPRQQTRRELAGPSRWH